MRRILFMIFFLFLVTSFAYSQDKILMVIAKDGFRDEELFVPKEIFETNGYEVVLASSSKGRCSGMLGHKVDASVSLEEVNVFDYQAIVFVGGVGAKQYWSDDLAHKIIKKAYEQDKVVAGICIAPVTLARAGILEGKKATVWPGVRKEIEEAGVYYTGSGVESDGNIITADGPGSSEGFGYRILEKLRKEK